MNYVGVDAQNIPAEKSGQVCAHREASNPAQDRARWAHFAAQRPPPWHDCLASDLADCPAPHFDQRVLPTPYQGRCVRAMTLGRPTPGRWSSLVRLPFGSS